MPSDLSFRDDSEEDWEIADYVGLRHAWLCPSCGVTNHEQEHDDPREIGTVVVCECGWTGKVQ